MVLGLLILLVGCCVALGQEKAILACIKRVTDKEAFCYLNRYPDLKAAFGDSLTKAKRHWCEFGSTAKENRDKACHDGQSMPAPLPAALRGSTQTTVTRSQGRAPKDTWVTRDWVMDRAYVWVDARVPYSQQLTRDGYRQDCSGFISYAWGLSTSGGGRTTKNIAQVCTRIYDKKEMQVGDILLGPGHVLMFGGWKDKSMEIFYQLAEKQPGDVCREWETSWKWHIDHSFVPYRYNFIH